MDLLYKVVGHVRECQLCIGVSQVRGRWYSLIESQPKSKDAWGKIVQMFGAEQWDQGLVVGFDSEVGAEKEVRELITCPSHCQCLLNLSIPPFRV